MPFFMPGCNILRSGVIISMWTNFLNVVFYTIGGFFSLCLTSQKTNRPLKLLCFVYPYLFLSNFLLFTCTCTYKLIKDKAGNPLPPATAIASRFSGQEVTLSFVFLPYY